MNYAAKTPSASAVALLVLVVVASVACGLGDSGDSIEAIRKLQAEGDFEASVEPLRRLLGDDPEHAEANFLYAQALGHVGQSHLVSWPLRKAMEDPDWLLRAGTQLAYAALAAYDFNEVIEICTRVLEQEPENVSALLMRANAQAHWRKDPELALADADRVLELDPKAIEAYEPRILALLGLGRLDEARESLAQAGKGALEVGASDAVLAWHCSTTAAFEEESGDIAGATLTWERCAADYPADLEVVVNGVNFYDAQGDYERALGILQAAVAAAPQARTLRSTLADRLRYLGRRAEGEAILRDATETDDMGAASLAWMDLAKFRQAMGEQDAAADAMERAREAAQTLGVPSAELEFEVADAMILAGRLKRAVELAEKLSVPAHRHLILGRVAQVSRRAAPALAEYEQALLLWPDNAVARYYAATAAEELGDFDRALAEYRYSIRISASATESRLRGASLLLGRGNPSGAHQMLHVGEQEAPLSMEEQILSIQLSGALGAMDSVRTTFEQIQTAQPAVAGMALAAAAKGLVAHAGPAAGRQMLETAPGLDFSDPRQAPALYSLAELSHESGDLAVLRRLLAENPGVPAFAGVRALDLELSGAPKAEVKRAYEDALSVAPNAPSALAGLGRTLSSEDPEAALKLFDRAASADPREARWKLAAARAVKAAGRAEEAAQRLDALLLDHPTAAEAAIERAEIDLERGIASAATLERARRAAGFGGGPEALELLGRVYTERGEAEQAAAAMQSARELRETREVAPAAGTHAVD